MAVLILWATLSVEQTTALWTQGWSSFQMAPRDTRPVACVLITEIWVEFLVHKSLFAQDLDNMDLSP